MGKKKRKIDPMLELEASLKDGASAAPVPESASDALAREQTRESAPEPSMEPAVPPSAVSSKAKEEEKRRLKKLRKAEKKEAKRKKKEAKRYRFVLYDPKMMQGFAFSQPIGYFLRFFSIGFSLFGVLWLFCDAFTLTEVSALPLLAYCVAMVSAFSMIFIGKWFTLAGFGLLAAWVGLFFWQAGNPLTFYVSGVEAVFNAMMFRLTEAGFAASASITLPYLGGLPGGFGLSQEELLVYGGVFALATVFALIFAAFSAKRTRLIPMVVLGGGLCAVCFTYNLCQTNWGIACVLAGLCSAAVLAAYDKTYKAHKHSRKSRAYSGYSAALAGVLALAIVALPAATVKERWGEIKFIADPIKQARMYVTTILTGGNPAYNKMNTLNERTSNKLEDVEFENVVLFKVTSPAKHSVYLRSWIGGDYDYKTDDWLVLDSTEYSQMMQELTSESRGFTGDQVTFDLYSLLAPTLSDGTFQKNGYEANLKFGYSAAFVDIEYINNSGQLFVLPSAYASPLGLLELGTQNEVYGEGYSIHADGMLTSGWFNLVKSYTAAAIMPSYYTAGYAEEAEREVQYYKLLCQYVSQLQQKPSIGNEEAVSGFRALLDEAGLTEFSTGALEYYLSLNANARARWYSRYVRLVREYSDYVRENYLDYPTQSEGIRQILEQIAPGLESADTTHDRVMAVIDYLAEHYAYTYTPTKPVNPDASALDTFLLETKDGYCVQFASAATLLLRAAGIPARYVQGYVASNMNSNINEGGELEYVSNVRDTAAHAWVEVYIEGLGWRTYEATPIYYEDVYYVADDESAPGENTTVTPPVTTPSHTTVTTPVTTTAPVSEVTEEEQGPTVANDLDPGQLLRIAIGLVIVAAMALLLLWQYKRAKKVSDGRAYFIERSIYGTFEEKSDFDRVAGVLCDSIFEIHGILGNRPNQGELPSEFARRVDAMPVDPTARQLRRHARLALLPNTFAEIMELMQKQEFGRALTRAELETLGTYLRALIDSEYPHLPFHKRIWYRYIRFMI
ncbi:MAG: transglutaminase family protein [Eubacteriales bacterium]